MERGKLIVIDGPDGSGKKTNSRRVLQRLSQEGILAKLVSFPNYHSDSSALVKRYKRGHFQNMYGEDNLKFVKQMSTFYAVDRIATMIKKDLSLQLSNIELMEKGFNIICDRYTTANILHMSANLSVPSRIEEYISWIEDLEYYELGLPRPDKVIFLDVTPEVSIKNMQKRYNNDDEKMDIHENFGHLNKVYGIKDQIIKFCGWTRVDCMDPNRKDEMLPFDDVHEKIYREVMKELKL